MAVAVVSVGGGVVIDRRADARTAVLQADLEASFAGTTSADLLDGEGRMAPGQPYPGVPPIASLTTAGGAAPDLITADGMVLQARYRVASFGGTRCLVATWTTTGIQVNEGDDRQCSGSALTLD